MVFPRANEDIPVKSSSPPAEILSEADPGHGAMEPASACMEKSGSARAAPQAMEDHTSDDSKALASKGEDPLSEGI